MTTLCRGRVRVGQVKGKGIQQPRTRTQTQARASKEGERTCRANHQDGRHEESVLDRRGALFLLTSGSTSIASSMVGLGPDTSTGSGTGTGTGLAALAASSDSLSSLYDLSAKMYGEETPLSRFNNKVTVVVNVASE